MVTYRTDCPIRTLIDLRDFIQMKEKKYPVRVQWELIKHSWVTTDMLTIWNLSEDFLQEKYRDCIGNTYADLQFFKELYNGLIACNNQYSFLKPFN